MIAPLIKPANAAVAVCSFLGSSIFPTVVVKGMPLAVSVELTNECNLGCPECYTGAGLITRERGFMSRMLFGQIVSDLGPYLYNINLHFQGESMMHPDFFWFLERCSGLNSTLSTNGHFLSVENAGRVARSGLRTLVISLDGMDQGVYSLYRVNGEIERVLEGVKNVRESIRLNKSRLRLVLQFIVHAGNEHQLPLVKKFARETGAAIRLKSMQVINSNTHSSWLPSLIKFRRYYFDGNRYIIRNTFPNRCSRPWFNPVITWEGKVLPCCFDKDARHLMGDLSRNSFAEIWNGEPFRSFRGRILSGRKDIDICSNCTSGLRGVRY
jgi:MoaA/NifB/PqqE/SkfB family radical SAM enzyme